jgi:phage-related holin
MYRVFNAMILGFAALFAPIQPVIMCALAFIFIDFLTGVLASRTEAKKRGERWYFSSREAWRTIRKATLVLLAIGMCWLVECCVLNFVSLHITRIVAGAICGVEMWSFLEKACRISDAPLLRHLRGLVRHKLRKEVEHNE